MTNEFQRQEEKFLLTPKTARLLYPLLKQHEFEEIVYEQKRVLTVYFGNQDGTFTDIGIKCKFRIYGIEEKWTNSKYTGKTLSLPLDSIGLMEVKYLPPSHVSLNERKKIRVRDITLRSAIKDFADGGLKQFLFNNGCEIPDYCRENTKGFDCRKPLRPMAATSYCRRHFYDGATRVTIDYDTKYFGVDVAYDIPYACMYPTKDFVKAEIKYISTDRPEIVNRVQTLSYAPQTNYNHTDLFDQYGWVKYKHPDELGNIEREIKLVFEDRRVDARKMLRRFAESLKAPFCIPHFSQKTSDLRYICFPNGSNVAVVYFPNRAGLKCKQNINAKSHVLVRRETFVKNASPADLVNTMEQLGNVCIEKSLASSILNSSTGHKKRSGFVITKPLTRERDIYTVCLEDTGGTFTLVADYVCINSPGNTEVLYQIEIEPDGYITWNAEFDYEKTVNHDLDRIKEQLTVFAQKNAFPALTTTHLCKANWALQHLEK